MIVVIEEPWAPHSALPTTPWLAGAPIADELFGFKEELVTTKDDLRSLPSDLAQLRGIDGFYAAWLAKH